MRETIVAGNWKMNKDHIEGAELAGELSSLIASKEHACRIIVFPPFTTIPSVISSIDTEELHIGAQDIFYEDEGAFTGEVSGKMLKRLGCTYVLVGHSERRHVIGEGAEILKKKLLAAFRNELIPVYCVGELLEEREEGRAHEVVTKQLLDGIAVLDSDALKKIVIAYEPVWAIGTGRTATPEDATEMHRLIREAISEKFGKELSDAIPILYGGSVKPENASELLAQEEIDGVLVGGASLKADSFYKIIEAAL